MPDRMGRLNDAYRVAIERGDRHGAGVIHEEIIVLDQQLSELLDRWEVNVHQRKAVQS